MKGHFGRTLLLFVGFMLFLLALGTGPIGLALLIMIGVPIGLFVASEVMAHSRSASPPGR